MAKKSEPTLGIKNIRIMKNPDMKIKAFFDVIIPSQDFGDIQYRNFKVVEGKDGLFVSLPNRAVTVKGGNVTDVDTGEVIRTLDDKTTYYNDIRFESKEHYNLFRDAVNKAALGGIEAQLKNRVKEPEVVEA
jgi:DNA-binding cell septation regulator SpoVG